MRRARQLTVLHETSVELTAELDLDTLLHSIVRRALNLIGGTACNCYLYNPQADLLERVASAGTALIPTAKTRQRGEGMVGQAWVKGTPLLVNDYHSWSGRTRAYDSFPSRALVAAPFRLGTEILGVLNIMAPLPHQYTQMDVDTLDLFSAQAAIAIRNAQLHDRTKMELAERRRAEEALRKSEELHTKLIATMPDIMVRMNLNGEILFINDAGLSLSGYQSTELIGQSMFALIAPEDHDKAARNTVLMFERRLGPQEYHLLTKDGRKLLFEVNGDVLRNEDGSPYGLLQICRDITDRKQTEEALIHSEEKFRKAFYTSPDSVNINRLEDGMYVSVNPGFTKIMGYTEEDIIGKTSIECNLWEKAEDRQRLVAGLRRDGAVTNLEAAFRTKSGKIRQGLMSATIIDLDGVPHILSITRNITKRKRAEEELQRTLESLRKSFAATIQVMVAAVESRDPYTAGHQIRSADLARAIATEMGLPQEIIDGIRMAGAIHDIGKLSIPAEILSKPTKLSELEFSLIKQHAHKGFEMLKDVESHWPLAEIVHQHHERMDGSGYPRKLKGEEILIEARILAVADVVEAMASHRPYRAGLGIDAALNEIEKNRGIFYDKTVADACLRLFREKGFKLEGA